MSIRDEILADVQRIMDESQPMPGDIFIRDLVDQGMDDTRAKKYLDKMVREGTLSKRRVVKEGRGCNAYRPVENPG